MHEQTVSELAKTVLKAWGGAWRVDRLIKYRENAVFAVSDDDRQRAVLRLHRPGYHDRAALQSELDWMHALSADGFLVPSPIPTVGGAFLVPYRDGRDAFADMLNWVPGRPATDITNLPMLVRVYEQLGRQLGKMHARAASWAMPADFSRPPWDIEAILGDAPQWGNFRVFPALRGEAQTVVLEAVEQAHHDLRRFGAGPERFGLIHADALADNVMVNDDGTVTLIDFDDCGNGWFLFDIVTCLYFHTRADFLPYLENAFLTAYREHFRFDESDAAHLPLFMFLRALTYVGWAQGRPETATAQALGASFVQRAADLARIYLFSRQG